VVAVSPQHCLDVPGHYPFFNPCLSIDKVVGGIVEHRDSLSAAGKLGKSWNHRTLDRHTVGNLTTKVLPNIIEIAAAS